MKWQGEEEEETKFQNPSLLGYLWTKLCICRAYVAEDGAQNQPGNMVFSIFEGVFVLYLGMPSTLHPPISSFVRSRDIHTNAIQ